MFTGWTGYRYNDHTNGRRDAMPSVFNILVCILALLVGVLIGKKYKDWKDKRK